MTDNLSIWEQVEKTDPSATKDFNRGGFKGTATNPTYLARKATSIFGPYGIGWGMDLMSSDFVQGHIFDDRGNRETIHIELWKLWYKMGEETGEVTHYGQSTFLGKNKHGPFTDEEAPKKTKTDAMTKCLALLGFSADIHSGKFDDVKYVNDLKQEEAAKKDEAKAADRDPRKIADALLEAINKRTTWGDLNTLLKAETFTNPKDWLTDNHAQIGAEIEAGIAIKTQELDPAHQAPPINDFDEIPYQGAAE